MQCARITVPRPLQQQIVTRNNLARILVPYVDNMPASKAGSGLAKWRIGPEKWRIGKTEHTPVEQKALQPLSTAIQTPIGLFTRQQTSQAHRTR